MEAKSNRHLRRHRIDHNLSKTDFNIASVIRAHRELVRHYAREREKQGWLYQLCGREATRETRGLAKRKISIRSQCLREKYHTCHSSIDISSDFYKESVLLNNTGSSCLLGSSCLFCVLYKQFNRRTWYHRCDLRFHLINSVAFGRQPGSPPVALALY